MDVQRVLVGKDGPRRCVVIYFYDICVHVYIYTHIAHIFIYIPYMYDMYRMCMDIYLYIYIYTHVFEFGGTLVAVTLHLFSF